MLAKKMMFAAVLTVSTTAVADVESNLVPFDAKQDVVVLKNDGFVDNGGQAYLQLGFVSGEKAGVYVKVPEQYDYFKVDYFRVLIGSASVQPADEDDPEAKFNTQVFFHMGVANAPSTGIPADIENAAQVTPGPYWNDIPAQGAEGTMRCARGGQYIGAALEFTHSGAPSVYRDLDGLSNITHNLLMGIPGGWNYSAVYGLRGDWILRIVGRPATAAECNG